MPLARDIARHFQTVGQSHARDLAQSRVRLLRRRGVDARAHPTLLRVGLHGRHFVPLARLAARLADQLLYRRHLPFVQSHFQRGRRPTTHSKGQRPTTPETEARVSATFSPLNQRILEASSQDRVPECDPVSPAASSPRREGLPPAAKVGALYQADSLIVKGSGGSEARIRISEIGKRAFSIPTSDFQSAFR